MSAPCNGNCKCASPCGSCPGRRSLDTRTWVGISVPAYAVREMGEEWLRARAAKVPFRAPFANPEHPRRREQFGNAQERREASEAEVTHHDNGASKQAKGSR